MTAVQQPDGARDKSRLDSTGTYIVVWTQAKDDFGMHVAALEAVVQGVVDSSEHGRQHVCRRQNL